MAHRRYVCGLLFGEGHLVLVRKERPGWQKGRFNGLGGEVKPGEDLLAAMKREAHEEAGVTETTLPEGNVFEWQHFAVLSGKSYAVPVRRDPDSLDGGFVVTNENDTYEVHFYRAFSTDAVQMARTQTDEEIVKLPLSSFPWGCLVDGLKYLIPIAQDLDIRAPVYIVRGAP